MTRRTSERHARRVEVRFWRRGHAQPHSGFTIDISKSGLFLGTAVALEPGERLRLEIVDHEGGFVVEGQVARVHRVSLAMRQVEQPGVGVRFLAPAELVAEMLAGARKVGSATGSQRVRYSASPSGKSPAIELPSPVARANSELEELFGPADANGSKSESAAEPPAPRPPAKPAEVAGPTHTKSARTVPVEFVDRASFLAVYHRDIAAGGLFVSTDSPAALHEVVLIELRPPVRTDHPLRFEARVVHRLDAQPTGDGKGTLAGMGVQFLDPDRVRATLAPLLTGLRS